MSQSPVMEDNLQEQFRLSRFRRGVNEAAMFVENNIVLSRQKSPVYAEQLDQFVSVEEGIKQQQISTDLWKAAETEKKKLFDLMEQVQAKLSKKSKGQYQPLDLSTCKWGDVMSEVQETSQKWKSMPGNMAKARKCLETLGQDSGAFQTWLELLPAGDYGASICGVFKLAVGAASRYVEVEEKIFDALSELPEMMEGARKYIMIYQDYRDSLLERKTFDLYLSILTSLNHIMQFFADSSAKKFFEPIAKQKTYKSVLTKSLDDVRKHTTRIKEEAQQCLAARTAKMDNNIGGLLEKVDDLPEKIGEKIFQRLYILMQSSLLFNKEYATQLTDRAATSEQAMKSTVRNILEAATYDTRSAEKLLKLLRYDPALTSRHLEVCQEIGETLDDRGRARASAMVESDKLKIWLAEDAFSSPLLLNGRCDLEAAEGLSPLSFVDAYLVKVFEQNEQAFVVKHFCSLHQENNTPSRGPPTAKMMSNLVGELLTQMLARAVDIDVSYLTKTDLQNVERLDLDILCNIFRELVLQLPSKTVLLCVLDELILYETEESRADIDAIMRRLTRLVAKETDVVFKLLVTCRGRSLDFQKYFRDRDILDLPVDVELDDFAMWKVKNIGRSERGDK